MDYWREKHVLIAEALEGVWKDYPEQGKQNPIGWEERNKPATKKKKQKISKSLSLAPF